MMLTLFRTPKARALLAMLALAPMTGCEQLYIQRAEEQRSAAELKINSGEYEAAVALYEASLDGTPASAAIHYKLGLLYDEKLAEPMSAVHHFRRYLALAPDGVHAKDAEGMIKEDQLKLITQYGHGATIPQQEAVRLKNDNLALRKQVLDLRDELEASSRARAQMLKSLGKSGTAYREEQIQKDLIPGVQTYTVQKGDTLASISKKFYNNPGRWKRIQDANFNAMEGTAKLKIGMVLMIP
jgi:nucleoid-associated protein YgaU